MDSRFRGNDIFHHSRNITMIYFGRVSGVSDRWLNAAGEAVWNFAKGFVNGAVQTLRFPEDTVKYITGTDEFFGQRRSWSSFGASFSTDITELWNDNLIYRTADVACGIFYGTIDMLSAHSMNYIFNERLGLNIRYFSPPPRNAEETGTEAFMLSLFLVPALRARAMRVFGIEEVPRPLPFRPIEEPRPEVAAPQTLFPSSLPALSILPTLEASARALARFLIQITKLSNNSWTQIQATIGSRAALLLQGIGNLKKIQDVSWRAFMATHDAAHYRELILSRKPDDPLALRLLEKLKARLPIEPFAAALHEAELKNLVDARLSALNDLVALAEAGNQRAMAFLKNYNMREYAKVTSGGNTARISLSELSQFAAAGNLEARALIVQRILRSTVEAHDILMVELAHARHKVMEMGSPEAAIPKLITMIETEGHLGALSYLIGKRVEGYSLYGMVIENLDLAKIELRAATDPAAVEALGTLTHLGHRRAMMALERLRTQGNADATRIIEAYHEERARLAQVDMDTAATQEAPPTDIDPSLLEESAAADEISLLPAVSARLRLISETVNIASSGPPTPRRLAAATAALRLVAGTSFSDRATAQGAVHITNVAPDMAIRAFRNITGLREFLREARSGDVVAQDTLSFIRRLDLREDIMIYLRRLAEETTDVRSVDARTRTLETLRLLAQVFERPDLAEFAEDFQMGVNSRAAQAARAANH